MDFLTLAAERYSVRKFRETPVCENDLEKILKAGHLAPTGCNIQPQRILVIDGEENILKLKECTRCHFDAPTALLVCYDKTECWVRKYDNKTAGECDAAIVTDHMMLEAAEIGVGSTWVMHFNPFKIREAFAIPDAYEPVALLVLGYPAPDAEPNPRHGEFRPMSQTVFRNKF